jgi:putative tryptophan/tyrosine transport system substrate-binding protein
MRRRKFIRLFGSAAAVAWPLQLGAQQPSNSRRIAFVHSGIPAAKLSESGGVFWIKTFYEELRKLDYAEGTNLVVERFFAEGNTSGYASLAAEVVTRAPELIVANQNVLVKALTTATATIPIVGITTDPIAFGLVSNIARPGGNLTGVSVDGGGRPERKALANPERDRADCDVDRIRD